MPGRGEIITTCNGSGAYWLIGLDYPDDGDTRVWSNDRFAFEGQLYSVVRPKGIGIEAGTPEWVEIENRHGSRTVLARDLRVEWWTLGDTDAGRQVSAKHAKERQ